MERGDLAVSVRPHYVVVLEGVLAQVSEVTTPRRFKFQTPKVTGYNINWLDLPLRRLATLQRQYPDVGADIVTFVSQEVADQAADFLEAANIPHSSLSYHPFDTWVSLLMFDQSLQSVFDSDEDRLDRYGQLGKAVRMGMDF